VSQASEPQPEAPAQIDSVRSYKVAPTVKNIKGSCQGKLRFEVRPGAPANLVR